jgi:Transposase and inactivated derivatives
LSVFKTRELPSDALVLYIDAYHCDIKASIYIVLGVDLQGNKANWIKVFNDLIDRGLKRVMLIVSDDFPGITKAIETLFPYTQALALIFKLSDDTMKTSLKNFRKASVLKALIALNHCFIFFIKF